MPEEDVEAIQHSLSETCRAIKDFERGSLEESEEDEDIDLARAFNFFGIPSKTEADAVMESNGFT